MRTGDMSLASITEEATSLSTNARGLSGTLSEPSLRLLTTLTYRLSPFCSGNATALLQSALDVLPNLPEPTCPECKPKIALMTIEPDALEMFRNSPLATHFTIDPLPPPPGGLRGHNQKDFNAETESDILDDTLTMLRDIAVLSRNADAFVVSANSNVGVIALIMGGPGQQISSVDFRFKPTTRSVNSLHFAQTSARLIDGPCSADRCRNTLQAS